MARGENERIEILKEIFFSLVGKRCSIEVVGERDERAAALAEEIFHQIGSGLFHGEKATRSASIALELLKGIRPQPEGRRYMMKDPSLLPKTRAILFREVARGIFNSPESGRFAGYLFSLQDLNEMLEGVLSKEIREISDTCFYKGQEGKVAAAIRARPSDPNPTVLRLLLVALSRRAPKTLDDLVKKGDDV